MPGCNIGHINHYLSYTQTTGFLFGNGVFNVVQATFLLGNILYDVVHTDDSISSLDVEYGRAEVDVAISASNGSTSIGLPSQPDRFAHLPHHCSNGLSSNIVQIKCQPIMMSAATLWPIKHRPFLYSYTLARLSRIVK